MEMREKAEERKLKMTAGLLKESGMVGNENTEGGACVFKHL